MGQLSSYHAKRDFRVSPEPSGSLRKSSGQLTFAIQKHYASHLHYDFRLEIDGTLKSWAVPKGPSLDPSVKRLAVHVEDHPLEYGSFEGEIPAGQYGAGEVILWDRGIWEPIGDARDGYRNGKLKFLLHGEKLSGGWTLVRTARSAGNKEHWLLIKERDEFAQTQNDFNVTDTLPLSVNSRSRGNAPHKKMRTSSSEGVTKARKETVLPIALPPQLATLVDVPPPNREEWSYEIKFDGYRILTRIEKGKVKLFTRNGHDWSAKLPHQRDVLESMKLKDAWLDGEIVVINDKGVPDFQALQNAFEKSSTEKIVYYVFDLPFYNGQDLRVLALHKRRELLEKLVAPDSKGVIRFSESFSGDAASILESACRIQLEGVIAKRCSAPYASGRSRDWVKLKCQQRQEFIIGGFTEPKNSRVGFGALLLGVHDDDGLRYAGRVGSGFDDAGLAQLSKKIAALEVNKPPFVNPPSGVNARDVHWIRPKLVAEVAFAEWTREGVVRQAVFHGLRDAKSPHTITRYRPVRSAAARPLPGSRKKSAEPVKGVELSIQGIKISNAARIVDRTSGLSKGDVVRYYEQIYPTIAAHLAHRPVSLVRVPESIEGEKFFQKHADQLHIPGVKNLSRDLDPPHSSLIAINSLDGLIGAAQMGTIELHTWNALASSIERPDRLIFDLDPDPALPWARIVEAAQLTKALLGELNIQSFLKTSGGKGLHVVVPLLRRHTWEAAKLFSQRVAQHLARTMPERFSAKMGPRNRIGKVFVDYLRNNRGSTTVAAYSVRARPGLPVSVPLAWGELAELKRADKWNIINLGARVAHFSDPWKDYEGARQSIARAASRLEKLAVGEGQ